MEHAEYQIQAHILYALHLGSALIEMYVRISGLFSLLYVMPNCN